ncbi:helix-turn-helix transcriptional regulator, partial [Robertmurraya sp. DFI.2.37]
MISFGEKQIGLSQPSLSRIESGNQEITFSLLEKICKALNISMGDFL